jgi:hypothetical protein
MTAGALVLLAMSVASGELGGFRLEAISTDSLVAMVYLTVIGSLLAFTAYGWLLRVAPLPLIATYAYVNPIVAVILGALVLREPIEPRTIVAGAVIVVSVAVIVTARGRMNAPRSRGVVEPGPVPSIRTATATSRQPADASTTWPGALVSPGADASAGRLRAQPPGRVHPWAGQGSQRSGRSSR